MGEGEDCDPPGNNVDQCSQTVNGGCLCYKLKTRDATGNCNLNCDCSYDPFHLECNIENCGAEFETTGSNCMIGCSCPASCECGEEKKSRYRLFRQ